MDILCTIVNLYLLVLFARIVLSWFPIAPGTVMAQVSGVLFSLTEPVLGPLRRTIPPVRMGGMGLDLSPMIVVFGIIILSTYLGC